MESENLDIKKEETKANTTENIYIKRDLVRMEKAKKYINFANEYKQIFRNILFLNFFIGIYYVYIETEKWGSHTNSFIYRLLVSVVVFVFLQKSNLVVNKKAYIWLIPINLIAFTDALFHTSNHFLNWIVINVLFGIMIIKATNINFKNIYDFSLLYRVIANCIPNFILTSKFYKTIKIAKMETENSKKVKNILYGLVFSIPFLIIVIILLGTADQNFLNIFSSIMNKIENIIIDNIMLKIIFFIFTFIAFNLFATKALYSKNQEPIVFIKKDISPLAIATFLCSLNFVYIVFLYLQLKYIITDGLFVLPSGFEYYEYAHAGFFPTFSVTIINFLIIIGLTELTKLDFSNNIFKVNFVIIFLSNILLIFSALNRMYIYVNKYGYTYTRILATLGLILELVLMILLIFKLVSKINFYKYAMVSVIVFIISQNLLCNDYSITALNFSKYGVTVDDLRNYSNINEYKTVYSAKVNSANHIVTFNLNMDSLEYIDYYTGDYSSEIISSETWTETRLREFFVAPSRNDTLIYFVNKTRR